LGLGDGPITHPFKTKWITEMYEIMRRFYSPMRGLQQLINFSNFSTALTITLPQPDNFDKIDVALRLLALLQIQGKILF